MRYVRLSFAENWGYESYAAQARQIRARFSHALPLGIFFLRPSPPNPPLAKLHRALALSANLSHKPGELLSVAS